MSFEIDTYLNAGTQDKELREKITRIHDNLLTAYKILESVESAAKLQESPSEEILLVIFYELQRVLDGNN